MFLEQRQINELKSVKHLLSILGKTNADEVEVLQPRIYRHISKRGITTIIHAYSNCQTYLSSGDDGKLYRCNGFYLTLKKP